MKFVFIVQGEGRGHMTQALALFELLTSQGHSIPEVLIGKSHRRTLPDFVQKGLKTAITQFDSPNFVADKNEKSINIRKTIQHNLLRSNRFIDSLRTIDRVITHHEPDYIINFYDLLAGIYNFIYRPKAAFWAIGHQYLIHHPSFPFATGSPLQKSLFKLNTAITALGAQKLLALSFRPLPDIPGTKLSVIPPLLRPQVKQHKTTQGDFILTYMVNSGYADEVISFSKKHPEIKIEAFWDKQHMPSPYHASPNLTFHHINEQLFLEKMASCKGLLSTAGFESICEAMYYNKPVMMVPVAGQYEQACNALDALAANAGMAHYEFDFKKFDLFLKSRNITPSNFVNWQEQLGNKLTKILSSQNNWQEDPPVTYPKLSTEH
ncbi:glycosyltransferase [Echinicola strongylocentroti]|uniref:Glycosyltransferase n=1 Tax=Echinicola strongylocentroti TaxID=1795355 RepID=A0A2Z4IMC7_9BACT|nr:glycosyltransferase family protein [Echinicola strongylocentroti]AWW31889.1 glycosyltransferase [Echinicola strongylocentroti]